MHLRVRVYFWEAFKNQSSNGVLHDHIVIQFKQRCHFCLQSKDIGFTHQSHFTVIFINILPGDAGLFIYALMLPATLNQTWLNKYTQPWCNRLFNFAAFLFTFSNSTAFSFLQCLREAFQWARKNKIHRAISMSLSLPLTRHANHAWSAMTLHKCLHYYCWFHFICCVNLLLLWNQLQKLTLDRIRVLQF